MTKHGNYGGLHEVMIEKISLQTFPKNCQWRHRSDVLWQSIPQLGSSDRKSL